MTNLYVYRYTRVGTTGCLPTHKIYINAENKNNAKFVFADDSFIYGVVSDWFLKNSDFDTRQSSWSEENKAFIEKEQKLLKVYKTSAETLRILFLPISCYFHVFENL